MNELSMNFRITDNMAQKTGIVTADTILDLFQTVGGEHAIHLGVGLKELLPKNLAWVTLRNKFEVLKPLKTKEEVRVVTWPHPASKIEFDRDYLIYDLKTNELMVKGSSKWVIMDTVKRRIARSSEINYNCVCKEDKIYDEFKKVNDEEVTYDFQKNFKILNSQTDILGHLNNSKYAEIIYNVLPKPFKSLQVDYLHEVKEGMEISLYLGKKANFYYVKALKAEQIIFKSKVEIEEI